MNKWNRERILSAIAVLIILAHFGSSFLETANLSPPQIFLYTVQQTLNVLSGCPKHCDVNYSLMTLMMDIGNKIKWPVWV